jgi:hypothetical protein
MAQLTFSIFVPGQIASKEHGAHFWRSFLHHFPSHVPTGYGHGANPTSRFDPNNLDLVLKKWNRRNVYFDGDGLSLSIQILRPRPSTLHETHTQILVCPFEDQPAAVKAFVYEISNSFMADYATAQILTKDFMRHKLKKRGELLWSASSKLGSKFEGKREEYEAHLEKRLQSWPKRTTLGPEIASISFRRGCIHDLYWLTVFGPRYVEFFGRDRILAMPAHEVRELSYGSIGVELTNELPDSAEAWRNFLVARDRAKVYLNQNGFFDVKLPKSHIYSGPIFQPVDYRRPRPKK